MRKVVRLRESWENGRADAYIGEGMPTILCSNKFFYLAGYLTEKIPRPYFHKREVPLARGFISPLFLDVEALRNEVTFKCLMDSLNDPFCLD